MSIFFDSDARANITLFQFENQISDISLMKHYFTQTDVGMVCVDVCVKAGVSFTCYTALSPANLPMTFPDHSDRGKCGLALTGQKLCHELWKIRLQL